MSRLSNSFADEKNCYEAHGLLPAAMMKVRELK
jgi:hypothetical protein